MKTICEIVSAVAMGGGWEVPVPIEKGTAVAASRIPFVRRYVSCMIEKRKRYYRLTPKGIDIVLRMIDAGCPEAEALREAHKKWAAYGAAQVLGELHHVKTCRLPRRSGTRQ